jgi:integrase/recombinase XerD
MVRIPSNPVAVRERSLQDLRDEFLVRCHAKNLSGRTIEWYAKHTELFIEWCRGRGVTATAELSTSLLEEYLIEARRQGRTPNTVRGYAQTLKTLSRFGHRKGLIPENITADFEMPKVPQVIIQTFSDEQLRALLNRACDRSHEAWS